MAKNYNALSPLGINTNEVVEFDSSAPFVNIFRNSLPFEEARPWLTKGDVRYDKNGWPTRLNGGQAGSRFINHLPVGTIPDGNYTVLYEGEGKLRYANDAKLVSASPNRDIISIKAGADKELQATLFIMETNERNPIKNIRILMPGGICSNNPLKRVFSKTSCRGSQFLSFEKHYSRIIFNPDYLSYMKDFKVIRFMNMSGITRNPITSWNQRPTIQKSTWGGKEGVRGAPLEVMVELANQSNADAWFTLPHAADDYYMRQFAKYVRQNLKPNLKAYIEYTNEAWNPIFTQAQYVKKMGLKLGLDIDVDKAGYRYFSMRSVQMFRIFEQEFGGTQRLVRVMGSWTGYTKLTKMLLSYRDAYKYTDALAIAPYFYGTKAANKKLRSTNDVFKMLYDKKQPYSIPNLSRLVAAHANVAKSYGVSLVAYEGGQHLVDHKNKDIRKPPTSYYIQANRDWRMAKAYGDFFKAWKDAGGQLMVNFSAPRTSQRWGSWGTKEYITQPDRKAPKHRAILGFIKNNRCWWKNCSSTQIARLSKPARNPDPKIFSIVPDNKNTDRAAVLAQRARDKLKVKPVAKVVRKPVIAKAKPKLVVIKPTTVAKRAPVAPQRRQQARVVAPKKVTPPARPRPQTVWTPAVVPTTPRRAVINKHDGIIGQRRNGQGWNSNQANHLKNIVGGNINGGQDLAANWQTSWDNNYLHIRVDTIDDRFVRDSAAPWSDDSIEVFVDADGSRNSSYDGRNDFHFIFRWRDDKVNLSQNSPRRPNIGILQTMNRTSNGYTLEASIPWSTLGVIPQRGSIIGLEVQVNDDDTGSDRDGKLAWFSRTDTAWKNPQNFGRMLLN